MESFSGSAIRRLFLDFFAKKGHTVAPSSSLVPHDDPTLLFTNAGMVQFKKVFLGEDIRPYSRATTCQKCVRAGGKHNDLENVGYTARHHTFFEMLGNFSFGDYFKEDAILYAWEFLTKEIGLPAGRLWVTVFKDDDESAGLWSRVAGISPARVVRLGEKDNFWAMGDTGPCGPCSEILFDQGEGTGCGRDDCKVGCDCDRFLEIWNLVFMQYFRDSEGRLHALPKKNIDTGMGLERITAVCQGKTSNFDTDIFLPLFACIGALAGRSYGADPKMDVAMRVIADHARASAFLIADGVMPSNEGRGYVLRRIIRRAVRYGRTLGLNGPFLGEVAKAVEGAMSGVYPELNGAAPLFSKVIGHEEARFGETLESGLKMLMDAIDAVRRGGRAVIDGDLAFKLYDTYGLPIDIVQDITREEGLFLDRGGFEKAMSAQRERSKGAREEVAAEDVPEIYRQILGLGKGGDFIGYDRLSAASEVLALLRDGRAVGDAVVGWSGELVVAQTPFYAESGGQVGDQGIVEGPSGMARVKGTVKRGGLIIHYIEMDSGALRVGDTVRLEVNEGLRIDAARNHTATHLLHAALRDVLGDHVKQAGSLVTPQRLRFDFNHFTAVTSDELRRIEDLVNNYIMSDRGVNIQALSYKEALDRGAIALFGEKYGQIVRLVDVSGVSMELCGGTHVGRTGQIGLFKIAGESSVASGVRRIEAVTGRAAVAFVNQIEDELSDAALRLRCSRFDVAAKIARLQDQLKAIQKMGQAGLKNADVLEPALSGVRLVKGIKVLAHEVDALDPKSLRDLADRFKDRIGSGIVALGARGEDKAFLITVVTKDLAGRLKAGDIIKPMASILGGSGGGRPDMAQAGGPAKERLSEALNTVYGLIEKSI
ncbi:MAG: alanine--tRNA ligase [Desulfobacteraceae bacterium]|nr:alanine--tRNA ligase [Desulfobacteraceae bacterium]